MADPVVVPDTPAPEPTIAQLAEKGDVAGFNAARDAQERGERGSDPVVEAKDGDEKPAEGETPAGEPKTPEELAEEAQASEAGKALAEVKTRREKRKDSFQQEIDTLRRQKGDEERALQQLRTERLALAGEVKKPTEPVADAKPVEAKPNADDYPDYQQYVEATGRWAARLETAAVEKRIRDEMAAERTRHEADAAARAQQDVAAQHYARIEAVRKAHPDFDEAVRANLDVQAVPVLAEAIPYTSAGAAVLYHLAKHPEVNEALFDVAISLPMRDAIMDSTVAPALLSHLVDHPDEALRIANLNPVRALREMGKLEARLDVAAPGPTSVVAPVTKAEPPIKPVGASATAATVSLQDLASQGRSREFIELRDRQERERMQRRA